MVLFLPQRLFEFLFFSYEPFGLLLAARVLRNCLAKFNVLFLDVI